MVEPGRADLSIVRQCGLLSISRSTFYAPPQGESDENLALMARQFLDTPFYGVRQMTWHLRAKGWPVNVERLWRSLKYECVYLHAWSGGREARDGIGNWIDFYNQRRPHDGHDGRTPDAVYYQPGTSPPAEMAA